MDSRAENYSSGKKSNISNYNNRLSITIVFLRSFILIINIRHAEGSIKLDTLFLRQDFFFR